MKSQKKVIAILTAGGSGTRFNGASKNKKPKQFSVLLRSKPVFLFPLIALQGCKEISGIFISAPCEYIKYVQYVAFHHNINKLTQVIEGGKTRFESVKNAFKKIECSDDDFVLIHDAARPNITKELLDEIILETSGSSAVIFGSRITETVKRSKKDFVSETLERENLFSIQTPQIFRYDLLKSSYEKAKGNNYTDESAMVEEAGNKVKIIDGPRSNIKITTADDLLMLKYLMKLA